MSSKSEIIFQRNSIPFKASSSNYFRKLTTTLCGKMKVSIDGYRVISILPLISLRMCVHHSKLPLIMFQLNDFRKSSFRRRCESFKYIKNSGYKNGKYFLLMSINKAREKPLTYQTFFLIFLPLLFLGTFGLLGFFVSKFKIIIIKV